MEPLRVFIKRIVDLNFQHGVAPEQIGSNQWIDFFQRDCLEKYNKVIPKSQLKKLVKLELALRK